MLPTIIGVAFIVTDNDHFLVIRRNPINDADLGAIAIPGGHVEENESPEDACRRELYEELELECDSPKFIWRAHRTTEQEEQTVLYYHCKDWRGTPVCNEGQGFFWLRFEELDTLDFDIDRQAIEALSSRTR